MDTETKVNIAVASAVVAVGIGIAVLCIKKADRIIERFRKDETPVLADDAEVHVVTIEPEEK